MSLQNYPTIYQKSRKALSNVSEKVVFGQVKKTKEGVKFFDRIKGKGLNRRTNSVASYLWKAGIRKGDHITIIGRPHSAFIVSLLAASKIGAVSCILNPDLEQDLNKTLDTLDSDVAFVQKSNLTSSQLEELERHHSLTVGFNRVKDLRESAEVKVNKDPYALAAILRTSGTMGEAKLPALRHANFSADIRGSLKYVPINQEDKFLSLGSWFHVFPLMSTLLIPLYTGASTIYYDPKQQRHLTDIAQAIRPTLLFGIPKLYNKFYKKLTQSKAGLLLNPPLPDFIEKSSWLTDKIKNFIRYGLGWIIGRSLKNKLGGKIKFLFSGSAPLSEEVHRAFLKWMKVLLVQGYGLSENSPVVTVPRLKGNMEPEGFSALIRKIFPFIPYAPPVQQIGSVGKVLNNIAYELRDGGQLFIQGPTTFAGYWTKDGLKKPFDVDGFYNTKDRIKEEEDVYILGRSDRFFVLPSGKNVQPESLEKELRTIPEVKDLIVTKIEKDGEVVDYKVIIHPDGDKIKEETKIDEFGEVGKLKSEHKQIVQGLMIDRIKKKTEGYPTHLRPTSKHRIQIEKKPLKKTDTGDVKISHYRKKRQ